MKAFSMLASAMLAAAVALPAVAADQTKLYDPMAEAEKIVVPVELLNQDGAKPIGNVVIVKNAYGLAFYQQLKDLAPGLHGFHVHANPDCGLTEKGLGMKAGGHWDPDKTGNHSYPWDDKGHKGDLPSLYVNADGVANVPVLAPKLKTLDEVRNHALMIHVGGDNFHDHPAALGGGGARMACGVIK